MTLRERQCMIFRTMMVRRGMLVTLRIDTFQCAQYNRASGFGYAAGVAQLAEQLFCKQQVAGSSPIVGSQGRYPSGQRGLAVNQMRYASGVRIPLSPPAHPRMGLFVRPGPP